MDKIIEKLNLHKIWVDTIGKEGTKLILDEDDLRSIDFSKYAFDQADIFECNLSNLILEDVDFHSSVLCSSSFKETNIINCDFYKANTDYCDFTNAVIQDTRFLKADFCEAKFNGAKITNCNFIATFCSMADFRNAVIDNVNFEVAGFNQTLFKDVKLKNITGIDSILFVSINIGSIEEPIMLEGDEAKQWFIDKCE